MLATSRSLIFAIRPSLTDTYCGADTKSAAPLCIGDCRLCIVIGLSVCCYPVMLQTLSHVQLLLIKLLFLTADFTASQSQPSSCLTHHFCLEPVPKRDRTIYCAHFLGCCKTVRAICSDITNWVRSCHDINAGQMQIRKSKTYGMLTVT